MEFKASALPPVGRLQSVDRLLSLLQTPVKSFVSQEKTLENDLLKHGILKHLWCFNIPERSKQTATDLDICSFELSFFPTNRGLKMSVIKELLSWDRKGYFFSRRLFFLLFVFSSTLLKSPDRRRSKKIKELKLFGLEASEL